VLQGGLVMAKSGRLELGDNIYGPYMSIFNHCDVFGQKEIKIGEKTPNLLRRSRSSKVTQGHRGWCQSKARMRLPITD